MATPHRFEGDQRTGHSRVERLARSGHLDGDGSVAERNGPLVEPFSFISDNDDGGPRVVDLAVIHSPAYNGREGRGAARRERVEREFEFAHGDGEMKNRSRRRPQSFGIKGIYGVSREDNGCGPSGVGRADQRPGVAGIAHVVKRQDETLTRDGVHVRYGQAHGREHGLGRRGIGHALKNTRREREDPHPVTGREFVEFAGFIVRCIGLIDVDRFKLDARSEGARDEVGSLEDADALTPAK